MKLIDGIPVWGTPDEGAVSQIKTCAKTADKVALMADHHKGYALRFQSVVSSPTKTRSAHLVSASISPAGIKQFCSIFLDQRYARTSARSWTMFSAQSASASGVRIKKRLIIRYSRVRHWRVEAE
jgi:hypothetical protein